MGALSRAKATTESTFAWRAQVQKMKVSDRSPDGSRMAGSTLPYDLSSRQAEQGVLGGPHRDEEDARHPLIHDRIVYLEISALYPIRISKSWRTSESPLLPLALRAFSCLWMYRLRGPGDNGIPESGVLLLTRTWIVWGEKGNSAEHVAITQRVRRSRTGMF